MMSFERLQDRISDWYRVPKSDLTVPESAVPDWLNPILKDFYLRFGALAQRKSQFAHPDSHNSPLSCQDHIVPANELWSDDGFTVFCEENQGVFVVAASNNPSETMAYAMGDAVLEDAVEVWTNVGVPLQECLVTCVLRETIMSVADRYRRITPDSLKMDRQAAEAGDTVVSRYIWPDERCTFYLSDNVWFMDLDGMEFSAHRDQWRHEPPALRERLLR